MNTSGEKLKTLNQRAVDSEATWSEFFDPITVEIDELQDNLTQTQKQQRVDPLMMSLITRRRELWQETATTRQTLEETIDLTLAREQRVGELEAELAELEQRPASTSPLRALRIEVHTTALTLAREQRDAAKTRASLLEEQLTQHNQHIQDISMQLRRVLPLASSQARSAFYDVTQAQNWHDAFNLLNDRLAAWRLRMTQRWLAANSVNERLTSVLLWILALLPRLFLFVIVSVMLRFIPAFLRRMLDVMLRQAVFRRNPGWAIKFYEVIRISFKPALYYWVASVIFNYVTQTFPEAFALWGAIEATFVFWLVTRIARTVFFSRAYREQHGYVSSGEVDDLTPTEASLADVFLLDVELSERAVRSTRSVALLVIAWTWALDLLHAIVGYSVLSYVLEWVLVLAIFGVIFGLLSKWRQEIAALFGRLLGDRAPGAQTFVNNHKDRIWGVAVIAGAAVVVILLETLRLTRRYLLNTDIIRQWNNFLFARKVELQSRLEERRFEPAVLSDAQLEPFRTSTSPTETLYVERGLDAQIMAHHDTWKTAHKQGSIVCVGEHGVGVSTLLERFAQAHDTSKLAMPHEASLEDVFTQIAEHIGMEKEVAAGHVDTMVEAMRQESPRVIVLDDLDRLFVRTVGGYHTLTALCRLISRTDDVHFWAVGCSKQAWQFLQKVSELNQYFGAELNVESWSTDELRELLDRRSKAAELRITFQSLDSSGSNANVVKTEDGYFRYLKDFVRGNPAASLHYWRQSLCVEADQPDVDYSIQLFERRHAQQLTRLGDRHAFMLSALVHYGSSSMSRLSEAMNLSESKCQILLDRLDDLEVIELVEGRTRIRDAWLPLVIRYLSDSNLLIN